MQKTIEAVYEHGVLRPMQLIDGLSENQRVLVTVSTPPAANPLAGWVGGLPRLIAQIEPLVPAPPSPP